MTELDLTIHKGNPRKPAVILIHGLGIDKNFWINPLDTKIIGRNIPMKFFAATQPEPVSYSKNKILTIGVIPEKIENLWSVLFDKGFNLITWSQRRPVGPISAAVEELEEVFSHVGTLFKNTPIALIGHSRGGLVARKFMEKNVHKINALITVATPHAGSSLAYFGKHLSPLSGMLKSLMPQKTHSRIREIMKNFQELIEGNAIKELLPDSDFFRDLNDKPVKGTCYLSFGGNRTKLITVYRLRKKNEQLYPEQLLTIPDSLIKFIPSSIVPKEFVDGKGDFMVTAESSVLPWAEATEHHDLHENHISISWNREVIELTESVLTQLRHR